MNPGKILVVDDEIEITEFVGEFLKEKGYHVITANDGFTALEKVKSEKPNLVLLDIKMPKMDGLETLKRIREIDLGVGVVMVTVIKDEEIGRRAMELGAFDFINKPIDLTQLENT
ncbi:response regulator, partial [candidate division KSB1 bacterium]|nr:response regulator [candidate division KSB1 bacterium]